jgi:DMSO/TMAO reductase YedYZ molybdopterin-dependent catalytic subunit
MDTGLPPGQRAIPHFPRFGVPRYANRLPEAPARLELQIDAGDGSTTTIGVEDLRRLPHREIVADFHCVTTWTHRDLRWSGYGFRDVYERLIAPRARDAKGDHVELEALDGYSACILLEDLLHDDVLLADRLQGEPISPDHGAPLRLVVPHLYGFKSVKHVCAIRLRSDFRRSFAERQTRAHPRGRVALEERGRGLPGPVYRVIYRALIPATLWIYRRAEKRRARTRAMPIR